MQCQWVNQSVIVSDLEMLSHLRALRACFTYSFFKLVPLVVPVTCSYFTYSSFSQSQKGLENTVGFLSAQWLKNQHNNSVWHTQRVQTVHVVLPQKNNEKNKFWEITSVSFRHCGQKYSLKLKEEENFQNIITVVNKLRKTLTKKKKKYQQPPYCTVVKNCLKRHSLKEKGKLLENIMNVIIKH